MKQSQPSLEPNQTEAPKEGKEVVINNCDGCQSNAPLKGVYHLDKVSGIPYMTCQKSRYEPKKGKEEADNIIPISYKGLDWFILVDIMPRFKNGNWWYNNKNRLIGQIKDWDRLTPSMIENEHHYKIIGRTVGLELFDVPVFEMPTEADLEPNQTEAEKEGEEVDLEQFIIDQINQSYNEHKGSNEAVQDAAYYINNKIESKLSLARKQVIEEIEEWVGENNLNGSVPVIELFNKLSQLKITK